MLRNTASWKLNGLPDDRQNKSAAPNRAFAQSRWETTGVLIRDEKIMNREELSRKLIVIANDLIQAKGYIAHVDIFMKLNYLNSKDYNSWRMKKIPYLERNIKVNLGTISFIMKFIRKHAEDKGLRESWTDYSSWGKGKKIKLQFSKSGETTIERAYATHLVEPKLNNKTLDNLVSCIANTPNKIMSIFDADLAWMEQGDTEVSSVPAKTKAAQKEA